MIVNKIIEKSLIISASFLFLGMAVSVLADSAPEGYLDFSGSDPSFNAKVYINLENATISDGSAIKTEIYYDSSKLDIGNVSDVSSSSITSVTVLPEENKIVVGTPTTGSLANSTILLAEIPVTVKGGESISNISGSMYITSQEVAKALPTGGTITASSNIASSQINGSPMSGNNNKYDYTPMEKIPGTTEDISAFPNYIKAIYKFAIWSVGIAALLMVSVGGFMYFSAAGNTSKLDKAKTVIRDSIFGLIAVLVAYLILYVINPDLVNVSLESFSK